MALRWDELLKFSVLCDQNGIEVPQAITRGFEQVAVAREYDTAPSGGLLDLSHEGVRERVTDWSIRQHQGYVEETRGMKPGIRQFEDELLHEVREACLPFAESITDALRPRFEEAATPIVAAVLDHGFTMTTTAESVLDRASEEASAAWRAVRPAWEALRPIAMLRQAISELLNLSPTPAEQGTIFARPAHVDFSIAFAKSGNWADDGRFYVNRRLPGAIDWFELASSGGLRLNSPDECRQKIHARVTGQPDPFTAAGADKTSVNATRVAG